ncbi:unnamed protein product [Meloidogyne enterolobii]|uniref:Uncharacterized protein n=1 Tax=Meloidogyne enterolobii TaxID=390850 RepID=A0ACB0YZM0_MELEN
MPRSDTGTGTGTSNPDATTSTGMPSPHGEQQTGFFGLAEIFGSHPYHNQQQPTFHEDYIPNPWPESSIPEESVSKQDEPTSQADYTPTNYESLFSPPPLTPVSFWDRQHDDSTPRFVGDDDLNQWLKVSQQVEQTSKQAEQAAPISQPDPKDKEPKRKGTKKERAQRRVKEHKYTQQQIKIEKIGNGIMGKCLICKKHGMGSDFQITDKPGVENCVDQHINSANHQAAIKSEGITSSKPQSEQQKPGISAPKEGNF